MPLSKLALFTFVIAAFHAHSTALTKSDAICTKLSAASASGTPVQKLNKYLDVQWKYWMTEFPEFATFAGHPGQNDRLTDNSLESLMRRRKESACALATLKKIPSSGFKGQDRINYELAKLNLEMEVDAQKFNEEFMPINHLEGMHVGLIDLVNSMPTATKKDYENIIARLNKIPEMELQVEALLKEGLKSKTTPVKMHLQLVPPQIDKLLAEKIDKSPLYQPFVDIKGEISDQDKFALRTRAAIALREKVYPSLQKLRDFLATTYIPASREEISVRALPNGKEYYAYLIRKHTSSTISPDELHTLGLKEVARLTRAMEIIKEQVKFRGSLKEFNEHLMKDKRFFYENKDALLIGYRDIAKRIDPELPKLFKTLPRLTYGVKEMPAYKAAEAPAAYYYPGSPDAGRAGTFEANTSDLPSRPRWGMEALTLHEAVPGHHLQIALGQEVNDIPNFRKHAMYTAFVEGWALYAESLGDDLGMYKDLYSRYGQLSYEMWRAIRLVVDTGIHAKEWTREQAIEFFANNMPKSQAEIEIEVDRYITWPGQALAYKVGQLKFKELREKATAALGDKFDIREFHDQVLTRGAMPMSLVERNVDAWIALQKKGARQHRKL